MYFGIIIVYFNVLVNSIPSPPGTLLTDKSIFKPEVPLMVLLVKAIDSTAAGDIFHGAFTYGIAKGFDFEKTLKIANIAGAVSVTRVGGRNSIPTGAEMREVYNEFK